MRPRFGRRGRPRERKHPEQPGRERDNGDATTGGWDCQAEFSGLVVAQQVYPLLTDRGFCPLGGEPVAGVAPRADRRPGARPVCGAQRPPPHREAQDGRGPPRQPGHWFSGLWVPRLARPLSQSSGETPGATVPDRPGEARAGARGIPPRSTSRSISMTSRPFRLPSICG